MLLIRPKSFEDGSASLSSSNISEGALAAWNSGTTYATDARVAIITGTLVQVYKSQVDGNLNNNPPSSSAYWVADGATYTEYDVSHTYAAGEKVISSTTHRIYESLAASNVGHALTDAAWWLDDAPTNRWAMFDSYNNTQTVHPYLIDTTISVEGRIDSLALLNLTNAVSARIIVTTATDGTVFDETFSLISTAGITDWYAYFFEDIERSPSLFVGDLPTYLDPAIRVMIEGDGDPVALGLLSIGLAKDLGETEREGASTGITDYSRKETDDFGNFTIVPRAFAKRGTFQTQIDSGARDGVDAVLTAFRTVPAVYVAETEAGPIMIFGFFRDFTIEPDDYGQATVSIELEGLT